MPFNLYFSKMSILSKKAAPLHTRNSKLIMIPTPSNHSNALKNIEPKNDNEFIYKYTSDRVVRYCYWIFLNRIQIKYVGMWLWKVTCDGWENLVKDCGHTNFLSFIVPFKSYNITQ